MKRVSPRLLVFSDLDGSLLDHDTYAWDEAQPALAALKRRSIPLVLVSSKTRSEVLPIRAAMGLRHPYIVENGAATYLPEDFFAAPGRQVASDAERALCEGPSRQRIQRALAILREQENFRFRSFFELGAEGIAEIAGMTVAAAGRANERVASEPICWDDDETRLDDFAARLAGAGLHCTRGGRFVLVCGRFDKGDAVARLARLYRRKYAPAELRTVAIGDAPNDLGMLEHADVPVIIKGRHTHPMPLETRPRAVRTELPGPAGWRQAVLSLLGTYAPGI